MSRLGFGLTLGIYPEKRGFGWVAFSGPLHLHDWSTFWTRTDKNLRSVRHFERLLERLRPELVVMEEPVHVRGFKPRSKRVLELQSLLKSTALNHGFELATYRRDDVCACFTSVGARTLREIAEAIARSFPELVHRLPRKRQVWDAEDRRMIVFCAAALVLTHFHMEGEEVADRMRS